MSGFGKQVKGTGKAVNMSRGGMPPRNKKYFRSTKAGAGMTQAGVQAYRRMNPGSKLSTAVTESNPGPKRAGTAPIILPHQWRGILKDSVVIDCGTALAGYLR